MMIIQYVRLFLLFILIFSSNSLHAMEAFEEDIKESRKRPLISGIDKDLIFKDKKVIITVCTTTLDAIVPVDHVYLVFEKKHPEDDQVIDLFSIHFGGDGHSSNVKEGRSIFDDRNETLIKVHGGREKDRLRSKDEININDQNIKPIYSKKFSFIAEEDYAFNAIKNAQEDRDLQYGLHGGSSWEENTYNCVTYAMKILKESGINIVFGNYCYLNHATNFLKACDIYLEKTQEQHIKWPDEASDEENSSQFSTSETENLSSEDTITYYGSRFLEGTENVVKWFTNLLPINTNISAQQNSTEPSIVELPSSIELPNMFQEVSMSSYYSDKPRTRIKVREVAVPPQQYGLAGWRDPSSHQLQGDWWEQWHQMERSSRM